MKTLKVEFQDANGKVIEDKTLEIGSDDKLIVTVKSHVTQEQYSKITRRIADMLQGESPVLAIPPFIEFSVLKVKA